MRKIDLQKDLIDIPKNQYTPEIYTIQEFAQKIPDRDECIRMAYASGQFTLAEIGGYFGLHYSRVSRIIKMIEYSEILD